MFFSEVSLGQGESVYPDLKERGEGGGFYQTKIPKTIARVERFFPTPRGKFFLTQEFIQMSLEKLTEG